MRFTLRQRIKPAAALQRQPSDESCSSSTSTAAPSKTHRRTPSVSGPLSIGVAESLCADVRTCSDITAMSWSSTGSNNDDYSYDEIDTNDHHSQERRRRRRRGCQSSLDEKGDNSMNADDLEELIRQLSFSPSRTTKKRTDTAETYTSMSSNLSHTSMSSDLSNASMSSDLSNTHQKHDNSHPDGLQFGNSPSMRRCPSSPLMGLKYID